MTATDDAERKRRVDWAEELFAVIEAMPLEIVRTAEPWGLDGPTIRTLLVGLLLAVEVPPPERIAKTLHNLEPEVAEWIVEFIDFTDAWNPEDGR